MNTENSNRDEDFQARAKRVFDDSVGRLDGHTRSKLAQARARAQEARSKRSGSWLPQGIGLVPAGAFAAAVLAVILVWQGPFTPSATVDSAVVAEAIADLDILLGEEELELFEELEFYAWLQEQPELQELIDASDSTG